MRHLHSLDSTSVAGGSCSGGWTPPTVAKMTCARSFRGVVGFAVLFTCLPFVVLPRGTLTLDDEAAATDGCASLVPGIAAALRDGVSSLADWVRGAGGGVVAAGRSGGGTGTPAAILFAAEAGGRAWRR